MTKGSGDAGDAHDLVTRIEAVGVPRARQMLDRATWAARSFSTYDRGSVLRIAEAVAHLAEEKASFYAEWAVRETGFGVVEHKTVKNRLCSRGILDAYRDDDYVTPRVDVARKMVAVPRPAGVVLALTPSTNPVSTIYVKVLLALMTRNAVVVSPHPLAKACSADAARMMADAAVAAGAPDGVVQVVDAPSIPLIDALMTDERTDVILATGGVPVVRSAYSSGNPAIGVGPGNVPVLVDRTADLRRAAEKIVDSKAFDNSVLCTNESVLIVEDAVADRLVREMARHGAHLLTDEDTERVRGLAFPGGHFDASLVGRPATEIAERAGVRVAARTRILLAPFPLVLDEEPLAHEKLLPVLGLVRVADARRGIRAAQAVLRIGGAGHSAVVHSNDSATVMAFAAAVPVLRVTVNEGGSIGSAGFSTHLAPSMTIGTGFVGRSSLGENLQPSHLVDWTRVAYSSDVSAQFPSYDGVVPWVAPSGGVPPYPRASNDDHSTSAGALTTTSPDELREPSRSGIPPELREELRRLIIDELTSLVRG